MCVTLSFFLIDSMSFSFAGVVQQQLNQRLFSWSVWAVAGVASGMGLSVSLGVFQCFRVIRGKRGEGEREGGERGNPLHTWVGLA